MLPLLAKVHNPPPVLHDFRNPTLAPHLMVHLGTNRQHCQRSLGSEHADDRFQHDPPQVHCVVGREMGEGEQIGVHTLVQDPDPLEGRICSGPDQGSSGI